jgi:thiol-disulfide isomerase/thioredoxin
MFTSNASKRCQTVSPTFEDLARRNAARSANRARGKVGFIVVDVDVGAGKEMAKEYGADDVPAFIFFKDGKKVGCRCPVPFHLGPRSLVARDPLRLRTGE